mmetsp:Transcript_20221/g.47803  ORF Transcript_20221/g.47803 Transcript_20221/m.47803 type:complete len:271 (-) Transcript_20221:246-1058(-)
MKGTRSFVEKACASAAQMRTIRSDSTLWPCAFLCLQAYVELLQCELEGFRAPRFGDRLEPSRHSGEQVQQLQFGYLLGTHSGEQQARIPGLSLPTAAAAGLCGGCGQRERCLPGQSDASVCARSLPSKHRLGAALDRCVGTGQRERAPEVTPQRACAQLRETSGALHAHEQSLGAREDWRVARCAFSEQRPAALHRKVVRRRALRDQESVEAREHRVPAHGDSDELRQDETHERLVGRCEMAQVLHEQVLAVAVVARRQLGKRCDAAQKV